LPGAIPSKIYEAMASSLPILLVASGEAARRVREANAGLTVEPRDAKGLREAYIRLACDPSLRQALGSDGRAAAESRYSRAAIADQLNRFLRVQLDLWSLARDRR
jgi:glycosyltransferase involved in cell wall biosynthesis